jgi:hypothetical protein
VPRHAILEPYRCARVTWPRTPIPPPSIDSSRGAKPAMNSGTRSQGGAMRAVYSRDDLDLITAA